jgi:hypothetical protein
MLPKLPPANDSVDTKASEEARNEIFNKISDALRTTTVKPIADTVVTKIISNFTSSLQEANKDLLETLIGEDKNLLKQTIDAISKLQGKNSKELDRLLLLAEKLILSGQTNNNEKMQGIGEQLRQTVQQGKADLSGTLSGDQDTFKNRFIRSLTGTTPQQARVQGTTVFGHLAKTSSRAFREGMGSLFVSDKERNDDVTKNSEKENKQISLAQQSAESLYKILDTTGTPKNNTNSPDNSAYDSNGNEITTNLSNPASSIDTATRSDAQELAAGIRDTDSSFSRSSTISNDPWEQRWKDLLDLMNKIKDCVCSCQCTDQMNDDGLDIDIDGPKRRRRNPRRVQGRGRIGTAVRAVGTGLLAAGSTAAAYGSSAFDFIKQKVGFGSKKTSGTAMPEVVPSTRTAPTAPATKISPSVRGLPTPANDVGVKLPITANDNDLFVEEQKKRVNQNYQPSGPDNTDRTPKKTAAGTAVPARNKITPATPANDILPSKKSSGFFSGLTDRAKNLMGKIEIPKSVRNVGGTVSKFAGRALGALGVGLDVYDRKKQGQSNSKVAVGVGSGLAGGYAGAAAGAAIGAFGGPAAPLTVPLGALIGGGLGYFGGSATGDFVYDKVTGEKKPASEAKPGDKKPGTVTTSSAPRQNPMAREGVVSPATVMAMPPSNTATTKTIAGLESGRNLDSNYIEKGTVATRDKMQINVPPPTVIQAPSKNAEGGQQIISGGSRDRMNPRPADGSWMRFQEKRAVA